MPLQCRIVEFAVRVFGEELAVFSCGRDKFAYAEFKFGFEVFIEVSGGDLRKVAF